MKVWVTKYALSKGLYEADGEECQDGMFKIPMAYLPIYLHGEGREWHRKREVAVERAELMRDAKIKSLEKQIAKLRKMEF